MPADPNGPRNGPASFERHTASDNSKGAGPSASGNRADDLVRAVDTLLDGGGPGPGARRRLDAPALRLALVDLYEFWLNTKGAELGITDHSGLSVVAVGGLGRREMLPYSDLDLILLHDNVDPKRLEKVADGLWYPLWDAHVKLDHSVRTVPQALQVAAADIPAAMGMLDARHIVGDEELSRLLIAGAYRQWRAGIRGRFEELVHQTQQRWRRSGEVAHRAEPDLKNGRGGLRDVQLLDALALAQLTDAVPDLGPDVPGGGLEDAHRCLLDVRTELHRAARRTRDQLQAQDADEIGSALRIGDRFDLARTLSDSARTISYSVDVGLRTAGNSLPRKGLSRLRRMPVRRPLDEGVVEHAGEVTLARDARPARDPGLIMRVAAASAQFQIPMAATTLNRLSEAAPELREPWPKEALNDLLVLLGSGSGVIPAVEALDRTGLWGRLIPEWGAVRDLPPRDSIHIWTVDRHIVETVASASTLTTRVSRPDLLLLGALLHDIGKGRAGDHSVVGAELATQIGKRLGLWPTDVVTLSAIVRHHLLLVETATRRDVADPATVAHVVDALSGDGVLLELLHALAEADSLATGHGVWGDWKASLIGELVRRCRLLMAGEPLPKPDPIDPELIVRAADDGVHVDLAPEAGHHFVVTVMAPDTRGLLSEAAGVLALHSLRVGAASLGSQGGIAINRFVVAPKFGDPPATGLLRQDLIRAINGQLDLEKALTKKERDQAALSPPQRSGGKGVPLQYAQAPPRLIWLDSTEDGEVLLEVRAEDRLALLSRIAAALAAAGANVRWAKVVTHGATVVDTFALELAGGDSGAARTRIETAVHAVVPHAAPTHPESGT